MIPIQDTIRAERWPVVNVALIALCGYGFWLELAAGPEIDAFVTRHALIPREFLSLAQHGWLRPRVFGPLFTSMFLHASVAHFAGNMLFLWIFGDNVEDRMGHLGYALFYLVGGAFAGLTQVAANPGSVVPTVGASGAIAAVMGAYMLLYPGSRVRTLVWVLFLIRVVDVPAYAWLGFWFLMQLLSSSAAAHGPDQGGVAFFAHIGGFAFGAMTVLLLGLRRPPRARAQEWR
ncbi:MAG TPA: rhomboid family intramembrane serine protease [Myxococcota bacterium]|nr:rhomboid family intramembrane serine protease [Myxococcota bacterium]